MSPSRPSAEVATPTASSRCSASSSVSRSSPVRPITAFIGVRISWLTLARKCDFSTEAWIASSRAGASSTLRAGSRR